MVLVCGQRQNELNSINSNISSIINNQQTGNLVFDGDWTVASGGVITGGRIMLIPVDSNQASNTFIDFKSGNWQRIRNLNGTLPDIIDTVTNPSNTITIPTWGCIIGRHSRGGHSSSIQLFYTTLGMINTILLPGDVILMVRHISDTIIQLGNGQILTPDYKLVNGVPRPINLTIDNNLIVNGNIVNTNLQTELNSINTIMSTIASQNQTGNFILDGNWTVTAGGLGTPFTNLLSGVNICPFPN